MELELEVSEWGHSLPQVDLSGLQGPQGLPLKGQMSLDLHTCLNPQHCGKLLRNSLQERKELGLSFGVINCVCSNLSKCKGAVSDENFPPVSCTLPTLPIFSLLPQICTALFLTFLDSLHMSRQMRNKCKIHSP